jgi:hypothetical protein
MRRAFALGAMMLLAFNPLALDFQRRVFLDNVATPWLLAAFALALSPRRRIGAVAGSALCFAAAVLSKETTLVLFPALLLQIWQHWDPRTRRFAIAIASVLGGLVISLYVVYAALKGELVPGPGHVSLWWSIDWQLFTRAGSGSMLDSSSGVRGLLETWLHLDAWLLGSAVLVAPCGLWFKRLRPVALAFVIIALMLVRGGYVPYPYVIAALPFAALVVAGVADEFWARSRFGPLPFASRRDGGARPSAFSNAAAWFRRRGRAVLVVTMALVLLLAAPAWAQGVRREMFEDRDVPMRNAQAWVEQHVSHQDVIVVDDSIWLDLIRAGYPETRVLWFYKVDLDPAVKLPHGWRDISYLVLGPMGDDALVTMPKLSGALQHSRVVETYGQGPDAVSVYRVMRGA